MSKFEQAATKFMAILVGIFLFAGCIRVILFMFNVNFVERLY